MDQKQMCYRLSNSKYRSRLHHGWIDCLRNHLCYEYEPCSGVQTIELLQVVDIPFFFTTGNQINSKLSTTEAHATPNAATRTRPSSAPRVEESVQQLEDSSEDSEDSQDVEPEQENMNMDKKLSDEVVKQFRGRSLS